MPDECTGKSAPARANSPWSNLGPIRADMALDHIPKHAGVYRLTFKLWDNTYAYFGEAGARGLRARIADHFNRPTDGDKAEHLLHDLFGAAIEAELSVYCTGVTLEEQKTRREFGKEAVAATRHERVMCFSKGGYSVDAPMWRFVLESEEKMLLTDLARVRAKLARLG